MDWRLRSIQDCWSVSTIAWHADVLAEAHTLLNGNHLACAAILARTGLESGLRRRARRENMPDTHKATATVMNTWLWKQGVYHKQTHDAVEGWIAPGNAFAHDSPEKDKYTHRDLARTLQDVQSLPRLDPGLMTRGLLFAGIAGEPRPGIRRLPRTSAWSACSAHCARRGRAYLRA
jgi:hypothetical protein